MNFLYDYGLFTMWREPVLASRNQKPIPCGDHHDWTHFSMIDSVFNLSPFCKVECNITEEDLIKSIDL